MNSQISVLTTLFNHEHFIKDTLNSALIQTLPPSEIIVLDDASTDNSLDVARSLEHPAIRVISESRNLGGPNTMKGLSACKGELIAILNSDDIWTPEKLQKQYNYMASSSQTGVVFTHVRVIDESGSLWPNNSYQRTFDVTNRSRHEWLKHFFLMGNPFCASSAFIRKECFDRLGSLNGSYTQLQDLDMWIRVAIAGYDLHVIKEPLTHYRVMRGGNNMSSSRSDARSINSFEYAKILRHYWRLSSLQELVSVFPEIKVADKADDSLTLFYLAQYAAKLPSIHHKLFALETMSHWGGDWESMNLAYECHGFDFPSYRNFFAQSIIRKLSRLSVRHQINSLALKVLPFPFYQSMKTLLLHITRNY